MNATAPFLAFASSRRCKNVDALQLIRRHASRQSSIGDGPEIELLPTIHRIRLAFPNITSSTSLLRQYLDCVCDLCKPQHNALGDPEREEALPLEIISSDDKLKAFAALVLAGCLFALREYHRDADNGLENFCRRVKSNQGLRGRLFPFAIGGPSTCPHDDPDPTTTPLPHQCIPCVATSFRACVRSKLRLLHVKSLRKWTKIEDIYSDSNLPIIQEQLEHADKRRPTLRFSRCRIEPTHCSPEELSRHELFRKRYTLAPQDDHKFEEDEAKIALSLASLEHPSIAKVLLAFREETNDDISYLSLLFKREDYSLEDYLQGHASQAFEDFTGRDGNHTVLLDHGLWKGLLGIVDAVATIHEVSDGTVIPKCAGPRITGHYDIKPANILISGHGSLLLTDFGQAARRKPGTNDYAPPELARSDIEPEKSYDAWSLACLLLQALVFIEGVADGGSQRGKAALEEFNSQRINETSSNRSAAFWIEHQRNGVMVKTLRGAVEGALKRLERWRHHQTQIVVEQLRSMLDINPVKRPSVRSCHKQFKAGVGRNIFRLSGDRQIEPMLATWITSFTTEVQQDPIPCDLFLYSRVRDLATRSHEINLTLDYEGERGSHSRADIRRLNDVTFVPILPLCANPTSSRDSVISREHVPWRAYFRDLLYGIVLHFQKAPDFFDFMALITHQQLLPDVRIDSRISGASIMVRSCAFTEERQGLRRDKVHTLQSSMVQIWKRLDENAYTKRFEHSYELSGPTVPLPRAVPVAARQTIPVSPFSITSMYKMALFTKDKDTLQNVCIVVDIGAASYNLRAQSPMFDFAQIRDGKFQATIYRESEGEVGFPAAPDMLEQDIKGGDRGMRIGKLQLIMEGESDFRTLRGIFEGEGFPMN